MEALVGYDVLQAFARVAPYIRQFFPQDVVVGVVDTEKYLKYERGSTFDLGIKDGDPVKPGSAVDRAMKSREKVEVVLGREIWGVPARAIAVPVFDEMKRTIGAVAVVVSMDNHDKLVGIIEQFTAAFQQVSSSIQEISAGAQNLAKVGEKLSADTFTTRESVKETGEIIQLIREIAEQTKLLGLNAAIEAARAGEHGRGFSVVAKEIRRLSEQSNSSAAQVKEVLNRITASIDSINEQARQAGKVSEEQSASTAEIAAAMEELAAQLESLTDFAKLI